ncbi:MAG: peptidoglycan DD-metalloendopeptidase family protein [Selenomonadaceae bacterium]|nr:peptidoglycan DD-metalloendopeptidase family protein [Selenomonadaceae bacterium]
MKKLFLAFTLSLILCAHASADDLEDEKASYDTQAEQKLEESGRIQAEIDSISEEKRLIDIETDDAVAKYRVLKGELDEIENRIEENTEKLKELEVEREKKQKILGKRVRDIYIHGRISYIDVLFGAKDFNDLMTRMDLLKRVVKQDYDLLNEVLKAKNEINKVKITLEQDRAMHAPKVKEAEKAQDIMLEKQAKRAALLERMKNDKAVVDRQYDELVAASKKIEEMIAARKSRVSGSYANYTGGGGGGMIWPLSGPITSEFGWRVHPITGTQKFHSGIDIGGDYGEHIHAAASGVVTDACWISGYGYTVIIDHGGGVSTLYGHNQGFAVSVGQTVSQGETIAYCGSTGNSTGPHCHFEVRVNGSVVSPYGYL